MSELLLSLEHLILNRNERVPVTEECSMADAVNLESKRVREIAGITIDEFALVMGVSVSSVRSWEAQRTRPSGSAQKLLQLLYANPTLYKQLVS